MKPYFSLGPLTIQSYIIAMAAAILVLVLLLYFREIAPRQKRGDRLPGRYAVEFFPLAFVLAAAGARLLFVVTRWDLFEGEPLWNALAFWRGGLVFYGGLLAVMAGGILYCRYRKLPFLPLLDAVLPYAALAYAIGRVGCFFNGCCYGHETDLPWAMAVSAFDDLPRHPTQLYASLAALAIFWVLLSLRRKDRFPGYVSGWFFILYGAYRLGIEYLRVTEPVLLNLTQAQLFSLLLLAAGGLLLLSGKRDAAALR